MRVLGWRFNGKTCVVVAALIAGQWAPRFAEWGTTSTDCCSFRLRFRRNSTRTPASLGDFWPGVRCCVAIVAEKGKTMSSQLFEVPPMLEPGWILSCRLQLRSSTVVEDVVCGCVRCARLWPPNCSLLDVLLLPTLTEDWRNWFWFNWSAVSAGVGSVVLIVVAGAVSWLVMRRRVPQSTSQQGSTCIVVVGRTDGAWK